MPPIPEKWWEGVFFGLHYDLHANANGWLHVTIPQVHIHDIIVIE